MRKVVLAALLAAAFVVASAMASQAKPLRAELAPDTVNAASEFTQSVPVDAGSAETTRLDEHF